MKLYDIPRGSKIELAITDGEKTQLQMCTFNNLDGMYSNITAKDGETVHLIASQELEKIDDYYRIKEENNE